MMLSDFDPRRRSDLLSIPHPAESLEAYRRFRHEDLPHLTDYQVRRELFLLTGARFHADQPHWWRNERVQQLHAEQRLRDRVAHDRVRADTGLAWGPQPPLEDVRTRTSRTRSTRPDAFAFRGRKDGRR